jgi:hypothetical protein
MLRKGCTVVLATFASTVLFSQERQTTIKTEVVSTFLWGEDARSGAISSIVRDPLTSSPLRKLSYDGIEVSARLAYERVSVNETGIFLIHTATIVNSTSAPAIVRYGGVSVDGHAVLPPAIMPAGKKVSRKVLKRNPDIIELGRMNCFATSYVSADNVFSANPSSQARTVVPGSALTVSSVFRDPRRYQPLRCSTDGCFPTGTIRYYVNVNGQDYIFVWPGNSAVNCGK